MSFNNFVWLEGNLTESPTFRITTSGHSVTNARMATNDRRKNPDSGEYENKPQYHRLVIWGKQAEFVRDNFKKGSSIKVKGRIEYRTFEREGVTITSAEIVAEEVDFGAKTKGETAAAAAADSSASPQSESDAQTDAAELQEQSEEASL